jgi:hypothetical protein
VNEQVNELAQAERGILTIVREERIVQQELRNLIAQSDEYLEKKKELNRLVLLRSRLEWKRRALCCQGARSRTTTENPTPPEAA